MDLKGLQTLQGLSGLRKKWKLSLECLPFLVIYKKSRRYMVFRQSLCRELMLDSLFIDGNSSSLAFEKRDY